MWIWVDIHYPFISAWKPPISISCRVDVLVISVSLSLAYLRFLKLLGCIHLCLSSVFGSFWPLFLQIFFLPIMYPLMNSQVRSTAEGFPTLITVIGFFSSMNSLVLSEVRFRAEDFKALVTFIEFHSKVTSFLLVKRWMITIIYTIFNIQWILCVWTLFPRDSVTLLQTMFWLFSCIWLLRSLGSQKLKKMDTLPQVLIIITERLLINLSPLYISAVNILVTFKEIFTCGNSQWGNKFGANL